MIEPRMIPRGMVDDGRGGWYLPPGAAREIVLPISRFYRFKPNNVCMAQHAASGYRCTRDEDHGSPHEATMHGREVVAQWVVS